MQKGVIIQTVINRMTFDGSTVDPIQQAVRDSLIAFMAATAQAQAEATKEAQKQISLREFLEKKPNLAETILHKLDKVTTKLIEKGLTRHTIVQAILCDYYQ